VEVKEKLRRRRNSMEKIQAGQFAQVHYTGRLTDGTIFDTSEGRQPLEFKLGSGQVIPGFEQAVQGMALNEEKKILIPSQDAYGPLRDDLKREFPKDMLGDQEVTEGQELWFQSPQGPVPGKVVTLAAATFTVDFNHPLAGKDLEFSVKLVGISNTPTQVQASCGCSTQPQSSCGCSPQEQSSCGCSTPEGSGGCGH
jgi:peptidylprolyl isomerase